MIRRTVLAAALPGLLAACDEEAAAPPPAAELTRDAVGYYDQMVVLDHEGPKAQIHLESRDEPVWFSSVRDAFAFTMLPEEPRDITAIYVNDMGRAASWADPGPGTWIEARKAQSSSSAARMRGGMGAEEPVPFGDEAAARAFAAENGGEVVPFERCPRTTCSAPLPSRRRRARRERARGAFRALRSDAMAIGRRRFIAITAAAAALPRRGARAREVPLTVWNGTALGARASIRLYHPDPAAAERLIAEARAEIDRLDRVFSLYRPDSALSRLNRDGALDAPPFDLVALLSQARGFSELTGGAFDATVQPLWRLYAAHFAVEGRRPRPRRGRDRRGRGAGRLPRRARVDRARIAFARPGMAITLNGIAQGYLTDRVAALFRAAGLDRVLLDLGEARALGRPAAGEAWIGRRRRPRKSRRDRRPARAGRGRRRHLGAGRVPLRRGGTLPPHLRSADRPPRRASTRA